MVNRIKANYKRSKIVMNKTTGKRLFNEKAIYKGGS
jgi:hypothetical protein